MIVLKLVYKQFRNWFEVLGFRFRLPLWSLLRKCFYFKFRSYLIICTGWRIAGPYESVCVLKQFYDQICNFCWFIDLDQFVPRRTFYNFRQDFSNMLNEDRTCVIIAFWKILSKRILRSLYKLILSHEFIQGNP